MTDPRAQNNRNPNSDSPNYPETYGGECPFCGEGYHKFPTHLTKHCEEKP